MHCSAIVSLQLLVHLHVYYCCFLIYVVRITLKVQVICAQKPGSREAGYGTISKESDFCSNHSSIMGMKVVNQVTDYEAKNLRNGVGLFYCPIAIFEGSGVPFIIKFPPFDHKINHSSPELP